MCDWLTTTGHGFDDRAAIKIDNLVSGNDGDVTLSFVLYELLHRFEKPFCIDIGADKGWVSMFCAKYKADSRVIAFEPTKEGFEQLVMNTKAYPSVLSYNLAISDCSGTLPFRIDGSDSHSRTDCEPNASFQCNTLQAFVKDSEFIHFVKIDTEGHEPTILFSIESMLPRIGSIVFEFTTYWYGSTREECLNTSLKMLEMISSQFEYIYMLSRRGNPILYGPLPRDQFLTNIEILYDNRMQTDIFASKIPTEHVPLASLTH
jgi:FkbM family methyltransferase